MSSSITQWMVPLCVAMTGPPIPPMVAWIWFGGDSKLSSKLVMQAEAQLSIFIGMESVSKVVKLLLVGSSDARPRRDVDVSTIKLLSVLSLVDIS